MSFSTPAFERARGIRAQQTHGLTISAAVYPALVRELCDEMESLLQENRLLREQMASRQPRETAAAKSGK